MDATYLTTDELASRIQCDPRTFHTSGVVDLTLKLTKFCCSQFRLQPIRKVICLADRDSARQGAVRF